MGLVVPAKAVGPSACARERRNVRCYSEANVVVPEGSRTGPAARGEGDLRELWCSGSSCGGYIRSGRDRPQAERSAA